MLRVITSATATRLTTADAVRAEFTIPDSVEDETIEAWIDRASAQIVSFCGRPFAQEVYRQKVVMAHCQRTLFLARTPATALTVTEGVTALTIWDDYHLDSDAWSVTRLRNNRPALWGESLVQFDYTGGYTLPGVEGYTLPRDVEYACILLAGVSYADATAASVSSSSITSAGGVKSETVEGVGKIEYYAAATTSSSTATQEQAQRLNNPTAEVLLRNYIVPGFA